MEPKDKEKEFDFDKMTDKELGRLHALLTEDGDIEKVFARKGLAYEKCNLNNARRAIDMIDTAKAFESILTLRNADISIECDNPLNPSFKNCAVIVSAKGSIELKTHAERELFSRLLMHSDCATVYAEKDFPDTTKFTGNVCLGLSVNNIWSD